MRGTAAAVFLFMCAAVVVRAATDTRETILWPVHDFPPSNILTGPDKGKGSADRRRDGLIRRLPQFHHQTFEASTSRSLDMLKTRPNVCMVGVLKTPERQVFMAFSTRPFQTLSNGVITTRKRLELFNLYFNERRELRLDQLLAEGRHRVGIISGRSFGAEIDALLKKHAGQPSIFVVPSSDHFSSRLLKLSNQNEFDAILGYPFELRYLTRQLGLNEQDFALLPIAGIAPLQQSFVACSKTEHGKRIVEAIDQALADGSAKREFEAAYSVWLDEETAARYDRLLKRSNPDG